ncbi:hypothetical protein DL769_008700 [Monosporascus sp. CRB-8-3]|nr:hypothetical protein DL769_008700 [Monosporascus sp. CRB-8-3]
MGRRRKDGRKPNAKRPWTFSQLMPKYGFNFGKGNWLLKHLDRDLTKVAFKHYTSTLHRGDIDFLLSLLVQAGVKLIDYVAKVPHLTFWRGIGDQWGWCYGLPERVRFNLVVILVQAHEEFERNSPQGFRPANYGPAAKATHEFVKLLKEKYGKSPEIMDLYFKPLPNIGPLHEERSTLPPPAPLTDEELKEANKFNETLYASLDALAAEQPLADEDYDSDGSEEEVDENTMARKMVLSNPLFPGLYYDSDGSKEEADEKVLAEKSVLSNPLFFGIELDTEGENLEELARQQQELCTPSQLIIQDNAGPGQQQAEVDSTEATANQSVNKRAGGAGAVDDGTLPPNGGELNLAQAAISHNKMESDTTVASAKRSRDDGKGVEEAYGVAAKRRRVPGGYIPTVDELAATMKTTGL